MPDESTIVLRPYTAADATPMRALVLQGLGDHFGAIDETMNPDLDDITRVFHETGAAIVIAERAGEIVGCGILIDEPPDAGRLVRMSVRSDQRGRGLGKQLVRALLDEARTRGKARVVCETTDDWHDAIGLYRACGFDEIGRWGGDAHFEFRLQPVPA
jgi:ribosomal protein S18 acetylase RimI-like enzyme